MKICISSGHGLHIRGARGSTPPGVPPQCDEVDEARKIVDRVYELLNAAGVICLKFHDNTSHDQSTNLATITNWHNAQGAHDLDVSVHWNAYNGTAHGTECLYVTQKTLAQDVANAIADAGGFTLRGENGSVYRSDLYFLNNTREKAILIETAFCDNTSDCNLYRQNFEEICTAISESISGLTLEEPILPPPIEEPPPVDEVTGDNSVNVASTVTGDVSIYVNGSLVSGHEPCEHVVKLTVALTGDVSLIVNGQEFHNSPPPTDGIKANHRDVFATKFGGAEDNEHSAYDGSYLDDEDLYVAFPYKWRDSPPPDAEVFCRATGKSARARTRDVGPWSTADEQFVLGDARPIAETCYNDHEPLPEWSGTHAGEIPSNPAGIDLSPALFRKLGMQDNGVVDFKLIEPETS